MTTYRFDQETFGSYVRSLELIETEVQDTDYADLPFASGKIVPLDIRNEPWAKTVTYRQVNKLGSFALQRSYSSTIPMIELMSEEFTQKVYKYAGGYYFSDDDIMAADHTGMDHEQEKIEGVKEAAEQQMNDLIAFGDPKIGMHGFLNDPHILMSYSPIKIDISSTPLQIVALLNDSVTAVVKLTKQKEKPETLLLPVDQYHYLSGTPMSTQNNTTILKFFLESSPYIKNIEPINELAGAGPEGEDMMIIYKRDRTRVKARILQPLTFTQLERRKLGFERPAVFRYGGIVSYRPYSRHSVVGI